MPKKTQSDLRAEYTSWTVYPARCAICWIPTRRLELRFNRSLELAHLISRARGGLAGNVVGNVLLLCSSCHGAQHQSGYTHEGVPWPDIRMSHLLRAKLEIGELSILDTAKIAGYEAQYILDLTRIAWPEAITAERLRWGG